MIRRHGRGLRMLLMLADGVLAAVTLVVASALRFGGEWDDHWRGIVSDPGALLFLYAVGWVGALAYFGLYRVRARWSLRSEALDLARATLVMAAITLAVLFWFRLPDISRTFLVILFPVQWLVTLISRIGLREFFRRIRAIGLNQRFVLMVGAGPRALAFATKLETHRDLGLTIAGFIDDDRPVDLPMGRTFLGRLDTIEDILHDQVIDEVAICLSFDQWDRIDAIARICEDEGKIVRVPMDVLDHAFAAGRLEELDGTPVFSLISGPDRVLGLAIKRVVDIVGRGNGAHRLESGLRAHRAVDPVSMTGRPRSSGRPGSASMGARSRSSSSGPCTRMRNRTIRPLSPRAIRGRSSCMTTRGSRRPAGSFAGPAWMSCRSCGTCSVAR